MRRTLPIASAVAVAALAALLLVVTGCATLQAAPAVATTQKPEVPPGATGTAASYQAPKHAGSGPAASCPLPIHVGIYPYTGGGPFQHLGFAVNNDAEVIASTGSAYDIFAGAQLANPQQGVLVVIRISRDPCKYHDTDTTPHEFDAPTPQGALTITGIAGDTLIFTAANAGQGQFDFARQQFIK